MVGLGTSPSLCFEARDFPVVGLFFETDLEECVMRDPSSGNARVAAPSYVQLFGAGGAPPYLSCAVGRSIKLGRSNYRRRISTSCALIERFYMIDGGKTLGVMCVSSVRRDDLAARRRICPPFGGVQDRYVECRPLLTRTAMTSGRGKSSL